jgi:hypothetical protein
MKFTNQSDTWQDLTRVKPRVTSAKRHVAQPVQRTGGIGVSGIEDLICQEHNASRTLKSRNAISRSDLSRWIRMRSGPLIFVISNRGFER